MHVATSARVSFKAAPVPPRPSVTSILTRAVVEKQGASKMKIRDDIEQGPRFIAFLNAEAHRIVVAGKGQNFRSFNYPPCFLYSLLAFGHATTTDTKEIYDSLSPDQKRTWEDVAWRVWKDLETLHQAWRPTLPRLGAQDQNAQARRGFSFQGRFKGTQRCPVQQRAPDHHFQHYGNILSAYLPASTASGET